MVLAALNLASTADYRTNAHIALYPIYFLDFVVVVVTAAWVGILDNMDPVFSVSWSSIRRCDLFLGAFRHRATT